MQHSTNILCNQTSYRFGLIGQIIISILDILKNTIIQKSDPVEAISYTILKIVEEKSSTKFRNSHQSLPWNSLNPPS